MFVLKLVGELWVDVLHFCADTPCLLMTVFLRKVIEATYVKFFIYAKGEIQCL